MFIPYCSVKSTTERITSAFKRKATWKKKKSLKQNVKQTIQMAVQMTAERFSTAKNPANYHDQETEMNEQVAIDIRITDDIMALEERLT